MTQSGSRFAALLTKAVRRIAAHENKTIRLVQDELGYALDKKGGASLEYWRKGTIPAKTGDIEALARELARRRGLLTQAELRRFFQCAGYMPHSELIEALVAQFQQPEASPLSSTQASDQKNANPFIVGPAITRPRNFFGRQAELERIFGVWQRLPLQNVAIVGPKRSGKSSLLHYLKNIGYTPSTKLRAGQRHDWLPQPHAYRWAFVDFQDPRMGKQARLLRAILLQLDLPAPLPCDLFDFIDIIVEQLKTPALVLMDEIGSGLEWPELDRHFWNSLRSLGSNQTNGRLAFALTAHRSPARLARDEGKTSPFFNIFGHTIPLGPLTEPEARELIAVSPQPFPEADIAWIIEQSRCWPCLVQVLSHTRLEFILNNRAADDWQHLARQRLEPFDHLLGDR